MPKLQLLPAVDVADGQAVRLVQGEAGSATSYGDPLEAAMQWQTDGAEWVHLVDLDAAFGRGSNRELLARVVGELDVDVQLPHDAREQLAVGTPAEGGVEVDQVHPLGAVALPGEGGLQRVAVAGLGAGLALDQADGLAVGDVDGGQEGEAHDREPTQRG